jgi:hypothetical protein
MDFKEATMKNRAIVYPLVALAVLALSALACGFSASTANIKEAVLAKGYDNGEAVDPTTVFAPSDLTIHLVVKVANAPDDTTVKAVWQIGQVEGYDPGIIDETTLTLDSGQDSIDFTLANDQLWPVGKYKVDLYLDDKLDRTLEYEVQ